MLGLLRYLTVKILFLGAILFLFIVLLTTWRLKDFLLMKYDGSLMPWRSRFEDWTTWEGDQDQTIGPNKNVGLTQYETRLGLVTRRYDALDPSSGKVGRIKMTIEAFNQPRRIITTYVSV